MRIIFDKRIFFLVGVCMLFVACSTNKKPEGILSEEVMESLLVDIHLVDAYVGIEYNNYSEEQISDSMSIALAKIFNKYGVTNEDFNRSIDYYTDNPEIFRSIYEKVILRLDVK